MKLSLACDHGGYLLKEQVKEFLLNEGYEVIDCGTNSLESCNYPVFARAAAKKVASKECELGIVICTSGEGVCMTANKIKGVRCGLIYNNEVVKVYRSKMLAVHEKLIDNNANMMALGAKYVSYEDAITWIKTFLNASFEGGRHTLRVDLIEE